MYNNRKKERRLSYSDSNTRIKALLFAIFLITGAIVFRLFKLQVLNHRFYNSLASDQHEISQKLVQQRGSIFMQNFSNSGEKKDVNFEGYENLYPVAVNKKYFFVYAEPNHIEDTEGSINVLSDILELEDAVLEKVREKNDPYEPLKHKVEEKEIKRIISANEEKGLEGIKFIEEFYRYYPDIRIGGHILGFVGYKEEERQGQYGIEGYFEELLTGHAGYVQTEKDVAGGMIKTGTVSFRECENGADIILTVDYAVQHRICAEIDKAVEDYDAEAGTIIVMEPFTGKIIGMCSAPDFNPGEYSQVDDISVYHNPAIFTQYEPGSIFKPITASIAIDLDKLKPDDTYEDTGEVKIGPHLIKNSDLKAHGIRTMTQVLEESLNTGAIHMARLVGKENFKSYLENFGFGQLLGIELKTEVSGDISSLDNRGEIYMATASFGQGISVTPLQVTAAFSALANGGKLPKPYIVDKIIRNNKNITTTQPRTVRQVISERASTLVSAMLTSVVENGHAKKAGIKGYYVAGKTGTAQVAENGIYGQKTIHSFIGFAPADQPKFVMLVRIDHPKKGRFAESTAVPVFNRIAEFLLDYYKVKPTR